MPGRRPSRLETGGLILGNLKERKGVNAQDARERVGGGNAAFQLDEWVSMEAFAQRSAVECSPSQPPYRENAENR